jgi:mitochondrial fission protein ELM1
VHIQKPDLPFHHFDVIAMPQHDIKCAGDTYTPKGIPKFIITLGAPNRITEKILLEAAIKWQSKFEHLPHPRIAVLVGGDNKLNKFTNDHACDLADKVNKLLQELGGGSLLVTTSRRTPPESINILKETLATPKFFYDFRDGGENPYTGILACADVIIPSGDSVSMCSESCTTGKPVYIYSPKGLTSKKHDRFLQAMLAKGYAGSLGNNQENPLYTPLSDAKTIADFIKENCC